MTASPTAPKDRGLQPERTSLAWRRTALSVAVGSLVGLRVLPPHLGVLGHVVCALGLVWSLDLALTSVRRYTRALAAVQASASAASESGASASGSSASVSGEPSAGPDVVRAAAMALLVGVLALVCIVVIAVG